MRTAAVIRLRLGAMLALVLSGGGLGCNRAPPAPVGDAPKATEADPLVALSQASQRVAASVRNAVVRINAEQSGKEPQGQDEFSQLFGSGPAPIAVGQGSGVIVAPDGDILTNYHVIRQATRIQVTLADDRSLAANIIGVDALTDLALLKVDAQALPVVAWGDSDALAVGALVWAVGSPYALERSVSFGIVSAKDREGGPQSPFQEFLQTDAAVNPGNSGGPLIDAAARLVGINTAIVGPSFQGISFAIPGNTARRVYERLKSGERIPRGWLGVSLDAVTSERAVQLRLPGPRGALIAAVLPNADCPAQRAGLRAGDVVTRWNGHAIDGPVRLSRLVAQAKPGATIAAAIIREGTARELSIVVGERPSP